MADKSTGKPAKPGEAVKEQTGFYDVPERYEIIGGIRHDFLASPTVNHQLLALRLSQAIDRTCHASGIIIIAPMDVHLDEQNTVQPDIIYVSNENMHIIRKGNIEGAPDLVVEILSRGTGKRDRGIKRTLYERFGIGEFWIVDPANFTVEQFVLTEGKYELRAAYGEEDTLTSERLSCIHIELRELFEAVKRFED